jgi:hypothetical protein
MNQLGIAARPARVCRLAHLSLSVASRKDVAPAGRRKSPMLYPGTRTMARTVASASARNEPAVMRLAGPSTHRTDTTAQRGHSG